MGIAAKTFEIMLADGQFDSLVAFFGTIPLTTSLAEKLRLGILEGTRHRADRLIVLCMVAEPDVIRSYEACGFLVYADGVRAIEAIAALMRAGAKVANAVEAPVWAGPLLPREIKMFSEVDAKMVLRANAIRTLNEQLCSNQQEAIDAAGGIGMPVAMKIVSRDVVHKTEIGGVMLNVNGATEVAHAYQALCKRFESAAPTAKLDGILVAEMAPKGIEMIVGITKDPTFGMVVMVGLGGVFVETLKDVSFRLAPVDASTAGDMIEELSGVALLNGVRGGAPADKEALVDVLVKLSLFAAANAPELSSLEINPLMVFEAGRGAVALDAS